MKFLDLQRKLQLRNDAGETRERRRIDSAQTTSIEFQGKLLLNFASNDYLGLANSDVAKNSITQNLDRFGFGSGGSHLISGHQKPHDELEIALANFVERDAAVTFSSGYMANLAILQSLALKGDLIVADKLNHASLIDGAQLSAADTCRYPHLDLSVLEKRLKQTSHNRFVVTDSVFSMDGDCAPLKEIVGLCERYQATLIVDDAHGFGVLGKNGKGIAEYLELTQAQLPVLMCTLGKALGGYGAFVSGEKTLVDYLIQYARSYIYTTAMPAIIAQANLANLNYLQTHPQLVESLHKNIKLFKQLCQQSNVQLLPSDTAIQPILIGDSQQLMQINQTLLARGVLVGAIRPPTVAKNAARFRVTLSAAHHPQQIQTLVAELSSALEITKRS